MSRPPRGFPVRLAGLFTALLAVQSPVRAHASDDRVEREYRYGYQTAIMDAAAAGILTAGVLMDEPSVYWTGAFAFLAGAPMVHVAQRNRPGAFMSVGVRIGAPLLLGLAGGAIAAVSDPSDSQEMNSDELVEWAGPGLVVGALLALAIDAQILAVRAARDGDVQLRAMPLATPGAAGALLIGRF